MHTAQVAFVKLIHEKIGYTVSCLVAMSFIVEKINKKCLKLFIFFPL